MSSQTTTTRLFRRPVSRAPGVRTAVETVLLAVADEADAGRDVVPLSAVVLGAWLRDRDRFGMLDYKHAHPDTQRVLSELSRAVRRFGWVCRVGPRLYGLTDAGRRRVAELKAERGRA